jgi:hypothetical protein
MSSILDALDKLDTATTPVGGTLRAIHTPPRRRAFGTAGLAGAVAAGMALVGIAGWSWSTGDEVAPPPSAAPVVAHAPLPTPAPVPAPRAAADGEPLAGVSDDELPWAEPTPTPEDAPAPAPAPLPRMAMARTTTASAPVLSDAARVAPRPEPREPMAPAVDPATLPPPHSRLPSGAPPVRLSFLMYSRTADRRSVALRVGDGSLSTLHEGETAGGFEVVAIHSDHAELRFDGERFDLWPRD